MLLHTTLLLKTLGKSCTTKWIQFRIFHCHRVQSILVFCLLYYRWTLVVGLSWRRPAVHPWYELCDGRGTNSGPNTSFSGRNRSAGVGSPAVNGSGEPADCLQPLAFPGSLLLLCLVDCCLPLLHLPLWPLLPSVSHGGIASPAIKRQRGAHRVTVCSAWSERTGWWQQKPIDDSAPRHLLSLLPPSFFQPPHNDWAYHQSSWFNMCFLHRWLCELLSLFLLHSLFIWRARFIKTLIIDRLKYEFQEYYSVSVVYLHSGGKLAQFAVWNITMRKNTVVESSWLKLIQLFQNWPHAVY